MNFTTEENKEVLTTTSTEGKTSFMVCDTAKDKNEKVCTDMESTKTGEKGMLDNNTYNLLEQLNVENKSLWRIKNNYKKDASMDKESRQVWILLEKDKQKIVKLLIERLKENL